MAELAFGDNVLEDPSFETDYWFDYFEDVGSRTYTPTNVNRTGDQAMEISDGNNFYLNFDTLDVEEGESWRLAIWYRTSGQPSMGNTELRIRDRVGGTLLERSTAFEVSESEFTRATVVYTVPPGVSTLSPALFPNFSGGTLIVDDIAFESLAPSAPDPPRPSPATQFTRGEESRWSYALVRTRDGVPQGWVEPAGFGSWGRRLDGGTGGSHNFHLATNPEVWERMRPARRTLVVCYDGQPVYAGVIWSARYDRNSGTVTLTHEDIWSIWERRFAGPHHLAWETDISVVESQVRYSGVTRRTLAKRIIQLGMRGISGYLHSYELPIILPNDEEGLWGRTFRSYTFETVADWLNRLAGYGGPMQVDFPMEFDNQGRFRWRLQVTYESTIETHLHPELDGSSVRDLTLTHDMSDFASELHVTGSGQDTETLHRYLWLGDVRGDLVAMSMHYSDGTADSIDEVLSIRDGLQQRRRVAAVQVDVTVALGGENGLSPHDFTLGQQVRIHVNDDPVLPRIDGGLSFMLIGYTPVGAGELRLELAPIDGFTGYDAVEPTLNYRNLNASRVQDLSHRINRAEKRLVYPRGGGAIAAATTSREDT